MATTALQKIFAGITDAQITALGGHQGVPLVQDVVTGKQIDKDGNQSPVSGGKVISSRSMAGIGDSFVQHNLRSCTLSGQVSVAGGVMTLSDPTNNHGINYVGQLVSISGMANQTANLIRRRVLSIPDAKTVTVDATGLADGLYSQMTPAAQLRMYGFTRNSGMLHRFCSRSGAYELAECAGLGGHTTAEILAAAPYVLPSTYDAITIDISLYNSVNRNTGMTRAQFVAQEQGDYTALIAFCKSIAPYVHVVGPALWLSSATINSAESRARVVEVRRWLMAYCAANSVGFTDRTALIVDPATGAGRAGYPYSGDKIHPTPRQADEVAIQMIADWKIPLPKKQLICHPEDTTVSNPTSKNILGAVGFTTQAASGTGFSGTSIAGISTAQQQGTPTGVCSAIPRSDGAGYFQQIVITGAANDQVRISVNGDLGQTLSAANAGMPLKVQFVRSVAGWAGVLKDCRAQLVTIIDGVTYYTLFEDPNFVSLVAETDQKDESIAIITIPDVYLKSGAACTLCRLDLVVEFASVGIGGSGGVVTVQFGAPEILKP